MVKGFDMKMVGSIDGDVVFKAEIGPVT